MNKDTFRKKVEKASVLSGQTIDHNLPDALYDELKNENDTDILLALKDVAYSTERISLGNITRFISIHKSKRIEQESIQNKDRERKEVQEFMKNRKIPAEVREFLTGLRKDD
jgi:hypothetical protein